jgi:2-methylisocitrate lyase-like PEP mutase family enzyme
MNFLYSGTSLSRIGWPDLGIASLPDMRANADTIANIDPSVPLIADADTGYGGRPSLCHLLVLHLLRLNRAPQINTWGGDLH